MAESTTSLSAAKLAEKKAPFLVAFIGVLMVVFLFWAKIPVALGFDPNKEKCLPDLHLSLMVFRHPKTLHDGELVFWKPAGALSYIKQEVVMKVVAAVPGDHLRIAGDAITVNGHLVTSGLALAGLYHRAPAEFQRDEIVPEGKLFVVGLHPHSDDSRYWGYLDRKAVVGFAIKLF